MTLMDTFVFVLSAGMLAFWVGAGEGRLNGSRDRVGFFGGDCEELAPTAF